MVEILLGKGYLVRGTVRDATKNVEHLLELDRKLPGTLKLYPAQLGDENAFDEVAKGCWGFLHIASVVVRGDETPEEQVEISKKGTLSALKSAQKGGVKTMVITSSVAAVGPTKKKHGTGQPYDESDWNDIASTHYGTYPCSKVESEKAAFQWWLDNGSPFRLSTIQFPFAFGPQQSKRVTTSNQVVQRMMSGQMPMVPSMAYNVIDIRDVAAAHVHVLESPKAFGDRFIVALKPEESGYRFSEIARVLKEYFPDYPLPSIELPLFFNRLMILIHPLFDQYNADIQSVYLGQPPYRHPGFSTNKLVKQLGFKYKHTNVRQSIKDTADSMIQLGIINKSGQAIPPGVLYAGLLACAVAPLAVLYRCCCRKNGKKAKEE